MFIVKRYFLPLLTLIGGLLLIATVHAECQIQLSDAQIAYPSATRGELLGYPGNALNSAELRFGDARNLTIQVSCDRPAQLTLAFNGAAKDSDSYLFGDNGRATLTLSDVFIDGQPVAIDDEGRQASEMNFTPGHVLRFRQNGSLATGTTLRGKVSVSAWVPAQATRVNERKSWELNGAFVIGSTG